MKLRKKVLTEGVVYTLGMEDGFNEDGQPYIATLEGNMIISEGDWILTGAKGERYPCKPDIIEMTYEIVRII